MEEQGLSGKLEGASKTGDVFENEKSDAVLIFMIKLFENYVVIWILSASEHVDMYVQMQ